MTVCAGIRKAPAEASGRDGEGQRQEHPGRLPRGGDRVPNSLWGPRYLGKSAESSRYSQKKSNTTQFPNIPIPSSACAWEGHGHLIIAPPLPDHLAVEMSQEWEQGWSAVLEDFEVKFQYLVRGLGSVFQDPTHHSHPPLALVGAPRIPAFTLLTSPELWGPWHAPGPTRSPLERPEGTSPGGPLARGTDASAPPEGHRAPLHPKPPACP